MSDENLRVAAASGAAAAVETVQEEEAQRQTIDDAATVAGVATEAAEIASEEAETSARLASDAVDTAVVAESVAAEADDKAEIAGATAVVVAEKQEEISSLVAAQLADMNARLNALHEKVNPPQPETTVEKVAVTNEAKQSDGTAESSRSAPKPRRHKFGGRR